MTRSDALELLGFVERFIAGEDRSRRLADEIEGIVVECCADEVWFDDVSAALAQYVPGGGTYYYDEDALIAELQPLVAVLQAKIAGSR